MAKKNDSRGQIYDQKAKNGFAGRNKIRIHYPE